MVTKNSSSLFSFNIGLFLHIYFDILEEKLPLTQERQLINVIYPFLSGLYPFFSGNLDVDGSCHPVLNEVGR
jgi:hypothetical protein